MSFDKQDSIDILNVIDLFIAKTSSSQAHGVHSDVRQRFSGGFNVGWNVFSDQMSLTQKTGRANVEPVITPFV